MKKILIVMAMTLLAAMGATASDPVIPQILINHLGYNPESPKNAVILGFEGDVFTDFVLFDAKTRTAVHKGKVKKEGAVKKWKNWLFWSIDFSDYTKEGSYYVEVSSKGKTYYSTPFEIQKDILERHTIGDVVSYFKSQRPVGLFAKADKNLPIVKMKNSETKEVEIIGYTDASGGWADATGDYSKVMSQLSQTNYFNTQQNPLVAWTLFKSYEELGRRGEKGFTQIRKRLLDEAMYGADYFVNIKIPAGSFYQSVSCWGEKRPEDRMIHPNNMITGSYNTGYREGAGLAIATLAVASTYPTSGEYSNHHYLRTAEDAFEYLEQNNLALTSDGKENINDDFCALIAAVELYKATNKAVYQSVAQKRAQSLMSRLTSDKSYKNYWRADDKDRPFYHPSDAGLPVVSLIHYASIVSGTEKTKVLDVIRKSMEFELAITNEVTNPFGYARQYMEEVDGKRYAGFFFPHNTETGWWWQGENARLGSLATAARLAAQLFDGNRKLSDQLHNYALNQINWILGLNPYDACMLEGNGHNNPQYLFYGSYEYKSMPGGIVNGITGGMTDADDIEFEKGFAVTGKDDDWRWLEQWIPHAAWYLYAVSLD